MPSRNASSLPSFSSRRSLRNQIKPLLISKPVTEGRNRSVTLRPHFYAAFIIGCVIQARIPMPRCASFRKRGVMTQQRKQSHDDKRSRPRRIDNDAGGDLRTCIPRARPDRTPQRPAARTSKCDVPSMLTIRRQRCRRSITTSTVIMADRK